MGTRGIWGFRLGQKDYLTYNGYDSYTDGLGANIVRDIQKLLNEYSLDEIKEKVMSLTQVTNDTPPTVLQKSELAEYLDTSISDQTDDDWYCLLRKLQGELIKTLQAGYIELSNDFILSSLHCEYGYIVNLDTSTFEVYRGFQHEPHTNGRYAKIEVEQPSYRSPDNYYYPCALVAEFPISFIPDDWNSFDVEDEE